MYKLITGIKFLKKQTYINQPKFKIGMEKGFCVLIPWGLRVLREWINRCSCNSRILGLQVSKMKTRYVLQKSNLLLRLWSSKRWKPKEYSSSSLNKSLARTTLTCRVRILATLSGDCAGAHVCPWGSISVYRTISPSRLGGIRQPL